MTFIFPPECSKQREHTLLVAMKTVVVGGMDISAVRATDE